MITRNLALDPVGRSPQRRLRHLHGVVTIDPQTGRATPGADYCVLGHVTRFASRAPCGSARMVAGNIWDVAFRNPDGSIVLLAVNDDSGIGSQQFNVRLGPTGFSCQLPAGAVVTFVIPKD